MANSPSNERFVVVDYLKAIGILFVVLIHAMRDHFDPDISSIESALKEAITFSVPFFFVASGYLYSSHEPIPARTVLRRLKRILFPYLIASIVGQLFWALKGQGHDPSTIVFDFLTANTFGIYYFVLVLFLFVLLTYPLSRLPRTCIPFLFLLSLAGLILQRYINPFSDLFWTIRDPTLWLHIFLFGWILRQERVRIRSFLEDKGQLTLAVMMTVSALCSWLLYAEEVDGNLRQTTRWLSAYALTITVLTLTWNRQNTPAFLRFLADSTYTVYLYHIFFILILRIFIAPTSLAFEPGVIAATWLAGFSGALAVLFLVRFATGSRSRLLVGG